MTKDNDRPIGMAQSMINLGQAIHDEYPEASKSVGKFTIKHGVGASIGGSVGDAAGHVASEVTPSSVAQVVGAGVIGGLGSAVLGMALTALLPVILVYEGGKWVAKKLSD